MVLHTRSEFIASISSLLRIRQWVKNCAVFAPLVFGGVLFSPYYLLLSLQAFFAISFISSSHYIINDIIDAPKDRLHPTKRNRPIARGSVSVVQAWISWFVCLALGMTISASLGWGFIVIIVIYMALHYLLLFIFRHFRIIDIMALSTGYALRLIAGEMATGIHMSVWLLLTSFCLSLLFAIGKRRYEAHIIYKGNAKNIPMYSPMLLDAYMAMFATATFLSYAYFSFLTTFANESLASANSDGGIALFAGRKWLMATLPFVLYGLMRYLQRMYVVEKHESYQSLLFRDRPLLLSVIGWGITVLVVIYGIGR